DPQGAFLGDEGGEFLRRPGSHLGAELAQRRHDIRGLQAFVDRGIELATMVAGVPAGATTPVNVSATKSGMPPSIIVGKSGASALRAALATPSARIFPVRTSGSRPATSPNRMCTSPATMPATASGEPLYGTWTKSVPVCNLNSSAARCVRLP